MTNTFCCCCELFSESSGKIERDVRQQDLVVGLCWLQFPRVLLFCAAMLPLGSSNDSTLSSDCASCLALTPKFCSFKSCSGLHWKQSLQKSCLYYARPALEAKSQEIVYVLCTHTNRLSQRRIYLSHLNCVSQCRVYSTHASDISRRFVCATHTNRVSLTQLLFSLDSCSSLHLMHVSQGDICIEITHGLNHT